MLWSYDVSWAKATGNLLRVIRRNRLTGARSMATMEWDGDVYPIAPGFKFVDEPGRHFHVFFPLRPLAVALIGFIDRERGPKEPAKRWSRVSELPAARALPPPADGSEEGVG